MLRLWPVIPLSLIFAWSVLFQRCLFPVHFHHIFTCHIYLRVCLWSSTLTEEPQRRMHAMDTRCYRKILHNSYKDHVSEEESPCQDRAGNQTTQRPPEDRKKMQTKVVWTFFTAHQAWLEPSCKAQCLEEEDKADRRKGGKTTSENANGRAWSSQSPSGQWRTEENRGNWLWGHLWCLNNHRC